MRDGLGRERGMLGSERGGGGSDREDTGGGGTLDNLNQSWWLLIGNTWLFRL